MKQNKNIYYHFTTLITNWKKLCNNNLNQKINNKVKEIDIKNGTYYYFNDIINMKNLDPNNIKIDESHTKMFLFPKLDL